MRRSHRDQWVTWKREQTLGRPQSFVSKTENAERRLDVIEFMDVCRGIGTDLYALLSKLDSMARL
ncbi:hypothetical protein BVY11_19405 [Pseudomonas amygdali pv. morsprunorum]|nr:hypothetical protein BVY11_19405 [Pseudomonas amygdali pv. morsprunorum]